MIDSRAVVLAGSAAGLRASARLARGGVAVRHLGLAEHPVQPSWPTAVLGAPDDLDAWLGPTVPVVPVVAVLYRGSIRPLPRRRRDLATLVGSTWAELAKDLRPHFREPRTLGQWGRRQMGRHGWERLLRALVSKRLGVSVDGEPAALAGLLVSPPNARWRTPTRTAVQTRDDQIEAILEAGGEPLEGVQVEALEVEDGRVRAIMTEFGREHVDGPLYCDLSPTEVAALLPPSLRADLPRLPGGWPVQERSLVTLEIEPRPELPWEIHVADASSPVVRIRRPYAAPGEPRADQVQVELECAPAAKEAADLARNRLQSYVTTQRVAEVTRITVPVPRLDAAARSTVRAFRRLGVIPVGGLAEHLPLDLAQEARLSVSPRLSGDGLLQIPHTSWGLLA